uniref:Uncharacterized protein n=1 Tax=Anguilla anguilla TaxID=7936 RepID=A0A0E9QFF7_ANGAN
MTFMTLRLTPLISRIRTAKARRFSAGGSAGGGLWAFLLKRVSSRCFRLLFLRNSSKRLNFKGRPFCTFLFSS